MKWMTHWRIIRKLSSYVHWREKELPSKNTASNNQYFLREVTKEYAGSCDDIIYKDSMVYIPEKDETEPARILTTIFKDDGEKFFELTLTTPSIEKEDLKDAMAGWIIFFISLYY